MGNAEQLWIEEGYAVFALGGPKANKIEYLAKRLKRNKSAFYYYFATLELFTSRLLDYHLIQSKQMAQQFETTSTIQELVNIMIIHKTDLLFNRQLRVHRTNREFESCFKKTNEFVGTSFAKIWKEITELQDDSVSAKLLLQLSVENFFLRITEDSFNQAWLEDYFAETKLLVRKLKR